MSLLICLIASLVIDAITLILHFVSDSKRKAIIEVIVKVNLICKDILALSLLSEIIRLKGGIS